MGYAKNMMLTYNVLGMLPFLLMPEDILRETWSGIKEANCPRKGACIPTLEWTVGLIYFQVVVGMALQSASIMLYPGKQGVIGAMFILIAVMAKHILVDGLMPPPPVMALTAAVTAAQFLADDVWAKRTVIVYFLLNAFVFTTQPLMVLKDTWSDITEGSEAFKLGKLMLEVFATYSIMNAIMVALPNSSLGRAYAWQAGLPILMKHVLINKSGPPPMMIALYAATLVAAWYEVGWSDLSKKANKAMEAPMKLHATIVATGFLPYFIAESVGISFPMLGMSAIDSSYSYTGSTALLCGMLSVMTAMMAHDEYFGKMSAKMFAMYHYFLSAVILFLQLQPTTTLLGVAFFMPPHIFTAWATSIVVNDGVKQD